jgi:hypothetical protein
MFDSQVLFTFGKEGGYPGKRGNMLGAQRVNTLPAKGSLHFPKVHSAMEKSSQHNDIESLSNATSGIKQDPKVKIHPRRYIQHNYHDHSEDILCDQHKNEVSQNQSKYSSALERFPMKLHKLLIEMAGFSDIISWQVHGRAFKVHKTEEFTENVSCLHFSHHHIKSFYRQLNLYGFLKITEGPDKGAYYHELFLRGKSFLAKNILRQKIKGNFVRGIANPANEPNFYKMPFVTSVYENASASFKPDVSFLLPEDKVNAADKASNLLQAKGNGLSLEVANLDIFSKKNDPFDSKASNDFFFTDKEFNEFFFNDEEFNDWFFNDEEFPPLPQELESPIEAAQAELFEDISLEDDISNSKQYFSPLEYVDMCAFLQMIIAELE